MVTSTPSRSSFSVTRIEPVQRSRAKKPPIRTVTHATTQAMPMSWQAKSRPFEPYTRPQLEGSGTP